MSKPSKREQELKRRIDSLRIQVWNLREQVRDWKRLCRKRSVQVKKIQALVY